MPKLNMNSLLKEMRTYGGGGPNEPTVICLNKKRGYVAGNIDVVSRRLADLINQCRDASASPEELRLVAQIIERRGIC